VRKHAAYEQGARKPIELRKKIKGIEVRYTLDGAIIE
jgi:hypothetical protein